MARTTGDEALPATASKQRAAWYRRPGSQNAALAVPFALAVFLTIAFASAAGSALTGLILAGVELLLGAVLLSLLSPLVMLRADLVRVWHGFQFTNISMNEIAGIGLLYAHAAGSGGNWRLAIWRDDGSREATGFFYRPRRELAPGKGARWVRQAAYDPVAASELPALNASRAAVVARDICQRVQDAQGPAGQLATRHLEKHQHPVRLAQYTQVIAYWSPDGEAGRCH